MVWGMPFSVTAKSFAVRPCDRLAALVLHRHLLHHQPRLGAKDERVLWSGGAAACCAAMREGGAQEERKESAHG